MFFKIVKQQRHVLLGNKTGIFITICLCTQLIVRWLYCIPYDANFLIKILTCSSSVGLW